MEKKAISSWSQHGKVRLLSRGGERAEMGDISREQEG